MLAWIIPWEYSGQKRGEGWGVTNTSRLKKKVYSLINEIKELKSKGHSLGGKSRGSSHMDNFDMDHEVDDEYDGLDCVLGENLPEVYINFWVLIIYFFRILKVGAYKMYINIFNLHK